MSAPVPSTRRLALAIGAAATTATLAIGVTAASLLGWFSPSAGAPGSSPAAETSAPAPTLAASSVILVPVSPTPAPPPVAAPIDDVRLAMDNGGSRRSDVDDGEHERGEHRRDHDGEEEGDDDD